VSRPAGAGDGGAPLLAVEGLYVNYGPVVAVRGVSFAVAQGEIVTLIGANGAGKTSTLEAVSGLVRPRAGRVRLDGQEVTRLSTAALVDHGVVLVPEGRAILARMTVLENLRLGGYRRQDRAGLERDVQHMLERFPILGQRRGQLAGSLSGGEQQQLALARGLLARPRLLLLDEPSMGLAPQIVRQIFRLVEQIRGEGVTILLVEQNARRALAIADRGYVLETGRIVLEGPASTLAADERVRAAYVGGSVLNSAPAAGGLASS
jgi:branched-chain amino acid transport system ATP-binding protein